MRSSRVIKILILLVFAFSLFENHMAHSLDTLITKDDLQNNGWKKSTLAEVGNIKISVDEFLAGYEFSPAFIKRGENSKLQYLNYLINEKLLAIDGYNRGVDTTEFVSEMHKAITDDLATEELYRDEILSRIQIDNEEIDKIVQQKQTEVELKWLYSIDEESIVKKHKMLLNGVLFDSLYFLQINDSITLNDRSVKMDLYSLNLKNPALAALSDSLKIGKPSAPIHTSDGWYIIYLENIWYNVLTTQSEMIRLKSEAEKDLTNQTMESLTTNYLRNILEMNKPVIKKRVFNQLVPYIANYVLPPDIYSDWDKSGNLSNALNEFNKLRPDDINNLLFITLERDSICLDEFLTWYIIRSPYIKFDIGNLASFSQSLESIVWRMVREKLLIDIAESKGIYAGENVKTQSRWWKDKIVFNHVKNELINSITLDDSEIKNSDNMDGEEQTSGNAELKYQLLQKMQSKISTLKNEYDIKIDYELLENIEVSDENNPGAEEFYTVKKDGLIPHTPYPSIDFIWRN